MKIRPVDSPQALKSFIELPYTFYREDPVWVPPLRSEIRGQFNPAHNPTLERCERALFMLEDYGVLVGRVAAFVDTLALEHWGELIGLFGYYECPPDPEASRLLLETAAEWLRGQGMERMRGPWSFVTQEWGLVVEGFSHPPVIMAPHNPPYYDGQMQTFGLHKAKDLLCYAVDAADGYQIPARILTATDAVAARYGVTVRALDMRRYDEEVKTVMELSNRSIRDNWGYSPVTPAEARAMARDLKQVIQPKAVVFAEDRRGQPIGFALAIPDVNVILKNLNGRLFPFGWLRLALGLPRLRRYRMFGLGVVPEYHGMGIDSLIYRHLYESLYGPDIWMEINYVLEDNVPMNNAIRKLNAKPLRRYRVYEREL
jgi:GNAT superfamily N-acetyltransferase